MDLKLHDLRSPKNPKARIKIMKGHFASEHAHVNTYIDISTVTCRHNNARETAKVLAENYSVSTDIDAIICLDGTRLIGAYMAAILAGGGIANINANKNISVITPEIINRGQMIFRDNTRRMIENQNVLILSGSITTGENVLRATSAAVYYKATVVGICSIFSYIHKVAGLNVCTIFTAKDVPDYEGYQMDDCPLCKEGRKIDALVNGYGYSLLN